MAEYYPDFGGKAVKLTIRHEMEGEGGGKFIEAVSGGWPKVLSNLKSLLETGDVAFKAVSRAVGGQSRRGSSIA